MPRLRTLRTKNFPEGWEDIEPTVREFEKQMKDAENAPMDAQSKVETLWRIHRLHHQRSRYIYELYYVKKEITRDLYDFLLREKYADGLLIAKWKKNGYEKLCCLQCVASRDTNYGGVCICRVPKAEL